MRVQPFFTTQYLSFFTPLIFISLFIFFHFHFYCFSLSCSVTFFLFLGFLWTASFTLLSSPFLCLILSMSFLSMNHREQRKETDTSERKPWCKHRSNYRFLFQNSWTISTGGLFFAFSLMNMFSKKYLYIFCELGLKKKKILWDYCHFFHVAMSQEVAVKCF